jgi:hypothetical protein
MVFPAHPFSEFVSERLKMPRLVPPRNSPSPSRRRLDSRLVVGATVVAASVAAGYLVVTSASQTDEIYVTRTTVLAGSPVRASDLELVSANLSEATSTYVLSGELIEGAIATRTIGAGEFVPLTAIGRASALTSTRLVVDVASGLPADTEPGTAVDVWATVTDPYGEMPSSSSIVVPGATFMRALEADSFASESSLRAELLIPRATIRDLLAAQGDGARIVVVPTISQAG